MGSLPALIPARFRKAAVPGLPAAPARRPAPRRRLPPRTISARLAQIVARRGFGSALAILFLSSAAAYGFVRGGHFETFVSDAGRPVDIAARIFGFGVSGKWCSRKPSARHHRSTGFFVSRVCRISVIRGSSFSERSFFLIFSSNVDLTSNCTTSNAGDIVNDCSESAE